MRRPYPMPLLAAALLLALPLQDPSRRADCREWHECRQLALDAVAAGDYERFHDFAWRTIQTGPKNDPDLLYLLARAQSLSGRPGDALVMLQRLAAMGITTDAATSDDFRRVRNLPAWTEFARGAEKGDVTLHAAASTGTVGLKTDVTEPARPKAGAADLKAAAATTAGGEAVRFETLPFTPAGIAYDSVSRRFILADRRARRLAVVDEFSQHVANLASAQSTGFGDIAAIEIDPRQGDLWVVSADGPRAVVHKLQLISGRALASYVPPERFGDVDLVDIAATPDNGVLVLDRAGHRILHLRPKSGVLEVAVTLPDSRPVTLAPAGNGVVYVAHEDGVARVDLAGHAVTPLKPATGVELKHITRLRWYRGSLIGVQRQADGSYLAVRVDLDRQGRAAAIHALATLAPLDPTAATISGETLYYLATADDARMTVGKLLLR